MHDAVALAVKAGADGYLSPTEITDELALSDAAWKKAVDEKTPSHEVAAAIYKPLQEKDASKAVAAQFCAYLLATGKYGSGSALLASLPDYLKAALLYVTQDRVAATSGHGAATTPVGGVA
jgi:putative ATP-dependent endonuclease of OLD family